MTPTVMLVEDNPITLKMMRFALEAQGFSVVDAPDGRSAVKAFAERPASLVLLDIALPDIDGFALVGQLRRLPGGAEVPILACSGLLSKSDEARMSAAGFDDVVPKPVEPSTLVQIVRSHLPAAGAPSDARERFGAGRLVLVADDDPVQRKLVAFRLTKVGFEVVAVADGQEALERARQRVPCAIVSDVLMPRLDGFGLCMSVRRDAALARVPVVLATNSYVEAADRDLARKAGASDLVLRTPELGDVMDVLRQSLDQPPPSVHPPPPMELEAERMRRVMRQLERQVSLHAKATQRSALLAAELTVLNGVSQALAAHDDIDAALRHALVACFDAGGISLGVLYLVEDGALRSLGFGLSSSWSDDDVEGFFGERPVLERALERMEITTLPSQAVPEPQSQRILSRADAASALIVPLHHHGETLGGLLMMSRTRDMLSADRIVFSQAVAGQIAQAIAVARAFSQQQRSERIAREQAAVLRSILYSIADAVVVSDDAGNVIHRNPAADAMLRQGAFFEPDQRTPVPADRLPLVRAIRGEEVPGMPLYLRDEPGTEGAWLSVTARPWRDDQGQVRGGVAVFRDVTRERAAQTQLMISDRMASVGMLAAGVAHEINNPLAAMLANVDLLQRELKDRAHEVGGLADICEMANDAREAADRVRQIVRDLKIFSRHEEVRPGRVDVQRVIESSVRMAWNEIRHRARLVREYDEVEPVEATESRLGQVFLNLIVNAAQAIPEGDATRNTITVRIRAQPSARVVVEVSDTGAGIPADTMPRLFTPFFTTKPVGVGTGLGLAICHRIITGLGGSIEVDSEVGVGTTFRVSLPVAPPSVVPAGAASAPWMAAGRARVLVIDDDAKVGRAIQRMLGAEHDVETTVRASDALARLVAGDVYDVILCDVMMPEMTGMAFHAEVAKRDPALADAIIFMTGGAFTAAARSFLDEVPNQRVEKPFDRQHLRALVNDRLR